VLHREKRIEASNLVNSKGKDFLLFIQQVFNNINSNLISQVNNTFQTLNSTILNLLNQSLANEAASVIAVVNSANSALSSGTTSLINTANASITSIITNLAATAAANIVAVVQDFSSSAGLLPQLLVTLNTIPTSASTLFFTVTQNEIANVTSVFDNASIALINKIISAIVGTNSTVLNLIQNALAQEVELLKLAINKFVNDLGNSVGLFLETYGNEVRRIVKDADGCNPCNIGPYFQGTGFYQSPGISTLNTQFATGISTATTLPANTAGSNTVTVQT